MTEPTTSRTNSQLIRVLKPPRARFYPCDFHVHSLGSSDVCLANRFADSNEQLGSNIAELMTQASIDWPLTSEPTDPGAFDESVTQPDIVKRFYESLVERRNEIAYHEGIPDSDNWSIVAITDHNTSHFSCALSKHSWERRASDRLIILPGMELEVHFQLPHTQGNCKVHLLCLFAPLTDAASIRMAINNAVSPTDSSWRFGAPLTVQDLPKFVSNLRSHLSYPAICIGAHVWSKKGIENEPKKMILESREAEVVRLTGELHRLKDENLQLDVQTTEQRIEELSTQCADDETLHMEVLSLIGQCGLDALQVQNQSHEIHYRHLHRFRESHGRSVPIVCSDAHSPSHVFNCMSGIPYVKMSSQTMAKGERGDLFRELQEQTLRFGETRTTYAAPGKVNAWIDGIEITRDAAGAREFWNNQTDTDSDDSSSFLLPLSRNLNCLVGGRGSGKSAVVEALAFLIQGELFNDEGQKRDRNQSDSYKRAVATLAGCRLRMVWKSSGHDGISQLPKKALIVSRYFDSNGRHESLNVGNVDGHAIVDDNVRVPYARILRAQEIEETARHDNLRSLFDDLCGESIKELDRDIESLRAKLSEQRTAMTNICEQLASLTIDGSPLRQYGVRK